METKRVTANGVDFAYLEAGEGPLVLCLHGFPDHAPTFEPLLQALADAGFRGVAPWMRGYSPTGVPENGKYHTQYLALDALALTDALAPDGDAYLVGSDWGAGAVHGAIAYKPDRYRKAVTMAVPPPSVASTFLEKPEQWKRSWYIWFFGNPLADICFPAADYAIIDRLWADWSPGFTPEPGFMRALKDTYAVDGGQAAMDYYRHSFHGRAEREGEANDVHAGPLTVPMLYFHGTDDGCLAPDLFDHDELRAALEPDGEFVLIEGAGHFMHLEKPAEVNAKIVEFLKK